MVDISTLERRIIVTTNEAGEPVVQMPVEVWERLKAMVTENADEPDPMDYQGIKALLREWQSEPDDKSPEWWAEFDQFLRDNRPTFPERNLGFGDE